MTENPSVFRLAHLSDPHLGPLPEPRLTELAGKRLFGYVNWRRNRGRAFDPAVLQGIVADIRAAAPDHVAVTGDLVNLALEAEFGRARGFLDGLGDPRDVSLVPGNHDAYVPGALNRALEHWSPFACGDEEDGAAFPYVRQRGEIAVVGVSTAVATGPMMATGRIGGEQARMLGESLENLGAAGLFRVVLIHHPPVSSVPVWHARLVDAERVRDVVARHGAELILHGHTHFAGRLSIPGPQRPVPVIGVPSATQAPGVGVRPAARWNLFEIEPANGHITMIERGYSMPGEPLKELARHEILVGHRTGTGVRLSRAQRRLARREAAQSGG